MRSDLSRRQVLASAVGIAASIAAPASAIAAIGEAVPAWSPTPPDWEPGTYYMEGSVVRLGRAFFRCQRAHISDSRPLMTMFAWLKDATDL